MKAAATFRTNNDIPKKSQSARVRVCKQKVCFWWAHIVSYVRIGEVHRIGSSKNVPEDFFPQSFQFLILTNAMISVTNIVAPDVFLCVKRDYTGKQKTGGGKLGHPCD